MEVGDGLVLACSALKRAYRNVLIRKLMESTTNGNAQQTRPFQAACAAENFAPISLIMLSVPEQVLRHRIECRSGHYAKVKCS